MGKWIIEGRLATGASAKLEVDADSATGAAMQGERAGMKIESVRPAGSALTATRTQTVTTAAHPSPPPPPAPPPEPVQYRQAGAGAVKAVGVAGAFVGRGIGSLFKSAAKSIGDTYTSAKRAELSVLADPIEQQILSSPGNFNIDEIAKAVGRSVDALRAVRIEVYGRFIARWVADGRLSPNDMQRHAWLIAHLRLGRSDTERPTREVLAPYFNTLMSKSVSDGAISPSEHAELDRVARLLGEPLAALAGRWFSEHGAVLTTKVFGDALDSQIPPVAELDRAAGRLHAMSQVLGIDEGAWRATIGELCVQAAHLAMAHCRTDHASVPGLQALVGWIDQNTGVEPGVRAALREELRRLELLIEIEAGRLPSIRSRAILVDSGELVHFEAPAVAKLAKTTRTGNTVEDELRGTCVITDTRLVVAAGTEAFSVKHRVVTRLSQSRGTIQILTPKRLVLLQVEDAEIAQAILKRTLANARGFVPSGDTGAPSRHISREVRQRVWTKYGGRCVDCGSTSYLEFDHIIPHAKGGSNAESNVQLLCRGCNAKKSDLI